MKQSSFKSTENQNSNESTTNELVERVEIPETPFTAIRYDEKWFLTMGKYRLTEPMDSLEQVKADAERADWYRVIQIIQAVMHTEKPEMMEKIGNELIDHVNKHLGLTTTKTKN